MEDTRSGHLIGHYTIETHAFNLNIQRRLPNACLLLKGACGPVVTWPTAVTLASAGTVCEKHDESMAEGSSKGKRFRDFTITRNTLVQLHTVPGPSCSSRE
jgi:hypothetical protein